MSRQASVLSLLLGAVAYIRSTTAAASTYQHQLVNYADVFVDPSYVLAKNWSDTTYHARQTILRWADDAAQGGPWSVTTKQYLAPSGDKHDYMSFAVYSWPDCSQVGNTTVLTPEEVWKTCPYFTKDGEFNPDNDIIKNSDDFDALSNAVLYNGLAWGLTGSSTYSSRVATFVKAWFLDEDTFMNPNLNYAQMPRGPDGQIGAHTGVLDLKSMTKLASGILVLRDGKAPEWTSDIDQQFNAWVVKYIEWLQTSPISLKEKAATNNHGSFFITQLATLQALVGDMAGAHGTINEYFSGIYQQQIVDNGDQPLESARTRPYHYRAYNLAAMITTARVADYVGLDVWTRSSALGGTIESALKFAMNTISSAVNDNEARENFPNIAAVAAKLGDPDQRYAQYLSQHDGDRYVTDATFFFYQPLSDRGYAALLNRTEAGASGTGTGASRPVATGKKGEGDTAEHSGAASGMKMSVLAAIAVAVVSGASTLL